MLNIGMIGPGKVADRFLAPALKQVSGARLWSVVGRDLGKAAEFARRHGAAAPAPTHTDLAEALWDPELHAVIIATPNHLHAPQAIAAAKAGKHLLVEKPLATSVEEGRAMVEAARASGVTLGVGYHLRYHAGHRLLAEQIRAGALGELLHARVQWTYRAAGVDLAGKRLILEPDAVRHTWQRHGPGETRPDQRPLTALDFELLPHVWRDPESVEPGEQAGDLVFSKDLLGRMVFATWQTGGRSVTLRTLYVKKKPAP